jgi:hypothetical protein
MRNADIRTGKGLNERTYVARRLGVNQRKNAIEAIAKVLKSSGYRSLDQQAKALGLNWATAWTIIRNKHKVGRLSKKTTSRILKNPDTPRAVRLLVQRYLAETGTISSLD